MSPVSVAQGNRLSREAILEVDAHDPLEDILAIRKHMRDALGNVELANLIPWDSLGVVAGIGGAMARVAFGGTTERSVFSAATYGVPAWTTLDSTVLCASYSSDSEETRAAYDVPGVEVPDGGLAF